MKNVGKVAINDVDGINDDADDEENENEEHEQYENVDEDDACVRNNNDSDSSVTDNGGCERIV